MLGTAESVVSRVVPGTGNLETADRMAAAHGDGSLSGGVHGESLKAITQYFQQRSCRQCLQPYTADGIEFLRQEPGVIVVRVACSSCGHPLGKTRLRRVKILGPHLQKP